MKFPNLYRCRDGVSGQHCLREDNSGGRRVLNINLPDGRGEVEWAEEIQRRFNSHPVLVEALDALRKAVRNVPNIDSGVKDALNKADKALKP